MVMYEYCISWTRHWLFWCFLICIDWPEATEKRASEGSEDDKRRRPVDVGWDNERAVRRRAEADDEYIPEDHSYPASGLRLAEL